MQVVLSLLAIVLSLLLVVGIHEAGHAGVAHFFKVKINIISIGFGKALFSWRSKDGCQWTWGIWPVGGYVQLLNSRNTPVLPKNYNYAFDKKPVWVRCVILLSGALANLLMAWFSLLLMLMLGYQQIVPVTAEINVPSIASTAGLVAGDRIIRVAGERVSSWRDVGMQLIKNLSQADVDVGVVNSSGVSRQVKLDLTQWHLIGGKGSLLQTIGIQPDLSAKNSHQVQRLPLLEAAHDAFLQLVQLITFFLVILKQLLTGVISFSLLLGPIGLFTIMIDSFLQGLAVFLYFIASLSLSVALVNLFPIPGLDGGSIIYALIERVRGKPVSVAMEILLHRLIVIAFSLLLVQLLLNDVQRYLH